MIIKKNGKNYFVRELLTAQGLNCYLCSKQAEHIHHIFYGRGKRKVCDREKLTVALCSRCHWLLHNRHIKDKELKAMAQAEWLKSKGGDTKENRQKWYGLFYKFYDL